MTYMDTLYRAFLDYRRVTAEDKDCASQRRAIAKSDADTDCVTVTRVVCTIEHDWIDAIEEGLVHVEKALAEERQFIRANGEIVPIEKVKRVSRDSVEHLSRHSNLITKESKGEDIIPEQLYTVERLNDYAVYENRFLYMLLRYLGDFIEMRYTKILDLTNTYNGTATLDKTIATRQKEVAFTLKLDEKRRDDPIMKELNPNKDILERISMLHKTVLHYLATPLMEEVAKAALLKPPITKTNVLKMDKNFKGAVALYDFITSYDKPGYTVETVTKKMLFSEIVADEFAELYALASFLTYEYGMGIKNMLKESYEEEEVRRKAIEQEQRLETLKKLRKRVHDSGKGLDEYILELEKQLKFFNGIYSKLDDALNEVARLTDENVQLTDANRKLAEDNTALTNEIYSQKIQHEHELNELRAGHLEELSALQSKHAGEIEDLNAAHSQTIKDLERDCQAQIDFINEQRRGELDEQKAKYEREMTDLMNAHRTELSALEQAHAEALKKKNAEIEACHNANAELKRKHESNIQKLKAEHEKEEETLRVTVKDKEKSVDELTRANALLRDMKLMSDGRYNALRSEHGLMSDADDFTSETAFNEIEDQYGAFKRFFKGEWKKVKRKIRDELLYGKIAPDASAEQGAADATQSESAEAETAPQDEQTPQSAKKQMPRKSGGKAGGENKQSYGDGAKVGDDESR